MSTDNVCYLFDKAVQLKLETIIDECIGFINDPILISHIFQSDSLLQMSLPAMRQFLSRCTLPFAEEEIWNKMCEWNKVSSMNADESDRKYDHEQAESYEKLKEIRDLIRFGLMDGKYFVERVKSLNILSDQEIITILVYYQCPDSGCGEFCTERRISKPKSEMEKLGEKCTKLEEKVLELNDAKNKLQRLQQMGVIYADKNIHCFGPKLRLFK